MNRSRLILTLFLIFVISCGSYSQSFLISEPELEFDGSRLHITYDFITRDKSDMFYVWVEMEKANGESLDIKALSGDVGVNIKAGSDKTITWTPEDDSVFLNEEVSVEIKAEKYIKAYKKGSAMLMSAALPGLGQTKISKGKPWWIAGVVAYGAVAGSFVSYSSYLKTYDSYSSETDAATRSSYLEKAEGQLNTSDILLISGAAIWVANMLWVAVIPNKYEPLQYVNVSFNQSGVTGKGTPLLTLRLNF